MANTTQLKEPASQFGPAKRWMRWIVFLPLLVVGLYLLIIFLVGWNMAHSLIHPKCLVPQTSLENHTHQEYWLPTEDGIEIRIWYYPSQNSAAVITFGGLNGSLGSDIPPVEALLEAGYGIVQVDSRACAQPSSPVTLGANEVYDAQAAFDFLRNRSEVDPDRIGAMGFSMGGATAIRLAARQPEIRSLVRDGGYASLADMFGQQKADSISARILRTVIGWIFHQQTGVDIHTIRPIDDLAQINPRPVLLIYGEMEAEPGLSQYQANGENSTLWIVPGGSHGKNHLVAPQEYQQRLLNFFNTTLLTVNPR